MSSSDDPPGWASSKLVPSVIFIITPIIAVGLLVIWSLRIQNIRRRYIAALARQAYAPSANRLDPRDIPVMHEVWIGDRWWDTGHDPALKASTAQAIPHMSSSKMEGHINGLYNWINIMVSTDHILITLTNISSSRFTWLVTRKALVLTIWAPLYGCHRGPCTKIYPILQCRTWICSLQRY